MDRIRYAIEHLPSHENPHHASQKSQLHGYCRPYHWLRINDDTIFVIGQFRHGDGLREAGSHPNVLLLPHLHDRTPVKQHLERKGGVHAAKYSALQAAIGLDATDTTADFIGKMLSLGHTQFEPQI